MNNRFIALCLLAAAGSASSYAQTPVFPFTFYIHDTTGLTSDIPLPSIYQFTATPLGNNSHITINAVNTSAGTAFLGDVFVTASIGSTALDPNFTVTGLALNQSVPAGGNLIFTLNFSPTVSGAITGYMQSTYQVLQTGCSFTSTNAATQCPSGLNLSSTLNATATQPQLVLSYQSTSSSALTLLQPAGTPLNFGNVSVSSSVAYTFTLANESSIVLSVPAISVPAPITYASNPFVVDLSQVPATLAPSTSATFTITFAPGQTGVATTSLLVGTNSYPLEGTGIVVASIDALQISYVDSTGVRGLPQAATPISFGQIVSGTSAANVLTFTVANPSTSYNAVSVSALTLSGTGFTLGAITGATSFPASLAPGASFGFTITFTPSVAGTYTGTIAIGTRIFNLSGLAINSPLPSLSLTVNPSPLSSQLQATVTVQLASAALLNLTGTIALTFSPSVIGVSDDPAIMFLANSSRQLALNLATGTQTATFGGQSALTFQTGTTAGTITFTVTFANTPAYSQSFTIPPAVLQIASASAVQSNPNLVVTVNGYDNTYSAGLLNFTFYDTSGKVISPISVNAAGNFHALYFGATDTAGGAFSMQATFPVTGTITQIGSVAISMSNSVGSATNTQTFSP